MAEHPRSKHPALTNEIDHCTNVSSRRLVQSISRKSVGCGFMVELSDIGTFSGASS